MLKEFIFGWKLTENCRRFLQIFQIGSPLETLTLLDTESGLGYWKDHEMETRGWYQGSEVIFGTLHELGWRDLPDEDDNMVPGSSISMRGEKRLRIMWTKAARPSLTPFLTTLTEL